MAAFDFQFFGFGGCHDGSSSCRGDDRGTRRATGSGPLAGSRRGRSGAGAFTVAGGYCRWRVLSLAGWSSFRIAEAFAVKPDSVRHWRWIFGREGVAGLRARKVPGPEPLKARAALTVVETILSEDVSEQMNWTLLRLQKAIAAQTGVWISRSRLSVVMRKKGAFAGGGHGTP